MAAQKKSPVNYGKKRLPPQTWTQRLQKLKEFHSFDILPVLKVREFFIKRIELSQHQTEHIDGRRGR